MNDIQNFTLTGYAFRRHQNETDGSFNTYLAYYDLVFRMLYPRSPWPYWNPRILERYVRDHARRP